MIKFLVDLQIIPEKFSIYFLIVIPSLSMSQHSSSSKSFPSALFIICAFIHNSINWKLSVLYNDLQLGDITILLLRSSLPKLAVGFPLDQLACAMDMSLFWVFLHFLAREVFQIHLYFPSAVKLLVFRGPIIYHCRMKFQMCLLCSMLQASGGFLVQSCTHVGIDM